jgi:teichuronic acid biosynthesis glycosyltransferase TuaG
LSDIFISIIIPTYNSAKFIKKAIESVFNQKYKNYELIIIDDGSGDDTLQICKEYMRDYNINIIKNSHCGNIAYIRNLAVKAAKGEYLAFLDSDDVWDNVKLENQLIFTGDYNLICSNARIIDENDSVIRELYFSETGKITEFDLPGILKENYIITSSVLLKKDIFFKYGLFDESYGNLAEDYSLWLKIAEENKIKYIDDKLISYRIHNRNISSGEVDKREDILFKTIRLRSNYLGCKDIIVRRSAELGILKIYRELSLFYLYYKKYYKSLKCMIRSVKYSRFNSEFSYFYLLAYYLKIIVLKFIGRIRY